MFSQGKRCDLGNQRVGVVNQMNKRDYYEILGVSKTASQNEIKKAYNKLAKKNHPDMNPDSKIADGKFKEVTEAYETLSDGESRSHYDCCGHTSLSVFDDGFGASRQQRSSKRGIKISAKARRLLTWVVIVVLMTAAVYFIVSKEPELKPYKTQFYAMDTIINITVYSGYEANAHRVLAAAEAEFMRIANLTNRFGEQLPDPTVSEIYRINNSGGNPVRVSQEMIMLIEQAFGVVEQSRGAFDITVGAAMDLWNFGGGGSIPAETALTAALGKVGMDKVTVNREESTVTVPIGFVLDLGAVAKGYATDCAKDVIKAAGIKHALVDAGGNIYAIGTKPDGNPWRIGIRNPRNAAENILILSLSDCAAVTSSDDQRFFIADGNRYHHILDPHTGKPSASGAISVTIVAESSLMADMLSTAGFVLGAEEFAKAFPDAKSVILLDNSGVLIHSDLYNEANL